MGYRLRGVRAHWRTDLNGSVACVAAAPWMFQDSYRAHAAWELGHPAPALDSRALGTWGWSLRHTSPYKIPFPRSPLSLPLNACVLPKRRVSSGLYSCLGITCSGRVGQRRVREDFVALGIVARARGCASASASSASHASRCRPRAGSSSCCAGRAPPSRAAEIAGESR
jgi:hypothetical protein